MTAWVSPLPQRVTRSGVKVFRPTYDVRKMADLICVRAWKGQGVRVFGWSCGTLAIVTVASVADGVMLDECFDQLLVTYARHGIFGDGGLGAGPKLVDVLHDLNWARAAA